MSYDRQHRRRILRIKLKGHQIIGELRHLRVKLLRFPDELKGHQIIGELRLGFKESRLSMLLLKGHQIIGELRPSAQRTCLSES